MSQYNQNLFSKTDEERALAEQRKALRAEKKRTLTNEKIAKAQVKRDHQKRVNEAAAYLREKGYNDVSVYNRKPKARPGYDFAKINGNYVAVPVTKRNTVPVAAVRATGAARSPQSLARDRAGPAHKIRYDPRRMNVQQYAGWASNPGRADVIGIDCRSNVKPTRSMNAAPRAMAPAARSAPAYRRVDTGKYRHTAPIKDTRGNTVKVPINQYGYVNPFYLKDVQNNRTKSAVKLDAARTSKRVMGPNITPYQARTWILDPASMDIKGIDAPKDAKVTYVRPKTEEKAKELQRKRNQIAGKKGGQATAKKRAEAKKAQAKPAAKKAAPKAAVKKAVAKKPVAKKA